MKLVVALGLFASIGYADPEPGNSMTADERKQIATAMKIGNPGADRCFAKYKEPGIADVSVYIDAKGKIDMFDVRGDFAGKPTAACIEAVVRTLKLPAFGHAAHFHWPYILEAQKS